jgi:protein-tyrosine-phosphatase/DNA-binding transcriptional ArsR family regulator
VLEVARRLFRTQGFEYDELGPLAFIGLCEQLLDVNPSLPSEAPCRTRVMYFDYSTAMEERQAAKGFAALAQETRLRLIRLLATQGASGLSAGEIASYLGQAPSTLSFHLSALEQAGLIQSTRQGRQIIYAVRFSGLRALFSYLTETCCGGRPDLCGDLARLLPEETSETHAMTPAFNVLFVCTRNSARSIMAEAILEKVGKGRFNAYSAGSNPAEAPMPEVIDRLIAMGHDVSQLRSKSWSQFVGGSAPRMDFVLTLCDPADGEACPDLGERPITAVWPFPDPAKFHGSQTERTTLLNELYGMIRRRLEAFTSLPFDKLDRMALKARLDELGDSSRMKA